MSELTARQRTILPLVFTITLTSIMGNSLLAPAIPDILDEFGQPSSSAGLLIAATSLPGVFMAPIIGLLADRFGRRAVLTPCLLTFGVSAVFIATAPSFRVLLMARFGLGLGAAGLVNLAIVLISDHFEGEQRTRWIGTNAGVLTIALAALPLVSGILTDLVGWRWALAPQSLGIVTALIAWRVLDGGRPPGDVDLRTQLRGAGHALRSRPIAISVIGAGLSFAVMFGVFLAALPTHLDEDFGLSAWGRGVMMGLPAISSSAVAFNLGRIRSRLSASIVTLVAASVWVVAFTVMGTAPVLWLLAAGSLTYGFGEGALIPTLQDAALSRAPGDQRAVVMAAWTASARAGQTVGPLAAAVLLAGPGSSAAVLAGAAGALVLVALLVPRPFDR